MSADAEITETTADPSTPLRCAQENWLRRVRGIPGLRIEILRRCSDRLWGTRRRTTADPSLRFRMTARVRGVKRANERRCGNYRDNRRSFDSPALRSGKLAEKSSWYPRSQNRDLGHPAFVFGD